MVKAVFLLDHNSTLTKGEVVDTIEKYSTYMEELGEEIGYDVIKVAADSMDEIEYEDYQGRRFRPYCTEPVENDDAEFVLVWDIV